MHNTRLSGDGGLDDRRLPRPHHRVLGPVPADESGETWWTLLLESWFWIGIPLVVSGALGIVGFVLTDALDRATHKLPPGPVSHEGPGAA